MFIKPCEVVSSPFGYRIHRLRICERAWGVDYEILLQTTIVAAAAGKLHLSLQMVMATRLWLSCNRWKDVWNRVCTSTFYQCESQANCRTGRVISAWKVRLEKVQGSSSFRGPHWSLEQQVYDGWSFILCCRSWSKRNTKRNQNWLQDCCGWTKRACYKVRSSVVSKAFGLVVDGIQGSWRQLHLLKWRKIMWSLVPRYNKYEKPNCSFYERWALVFRTSLLDFGFSLDSWPSSLDSSRLSLDTSKVYWKPPVCWTLSWVGWRLCEVGWTVAGLCWRLPCMFWIPSRTTYLKNYSSIFTTPFGPTLIYAFSKRTKPFHIEL